MVTKSKAEFLRNIPELEDLLWDLTPIDEDRYEEKRAEFRMCREASRIGRGRPG